jgi:two-component system chemotaxis sensor kinase CheA
VEEIIGEFVAESLENLEAMERHLVELERDPESTECLADIFRTVHSIKGTCGFLDFARLERLAHVGETLLAHVRDGQQRLTPELVSLGFRLVDRLREFIETIGSSGGEGDVDAAELIAALVAATRDDDETRAQGGGSVPILLEEDAEATEVVPAEGGGETEPVEVDAAAREEPAGNASERGHVRVEVELLDRIVALVGELVLVRNQIAGVLEATPTSAEGNGAQRLMMVTSELQETVMRTRLLRIDTVFRSLPRLVRDMAKSAGKKVRLVIRGGETELDRGLVEAIRDPLLHAVRNSIDHGIEAPAERREAGKPEEGQLAVVAHHENGQVILEIRDDGRGVDVEALKQRAATFGFDGDKLRSLDHEAALQLAFVPGISTSEEVTRVSGRGVGMDVVRANIERIGGSVRLASEIGRETRVEIRIPLTLAIMPALIVRSGDERYAIPQASLRELLRVEVGAAHGAIDRVHNVLVFRRRGRLLPLVRLRDVFAPGTGGADPPPETAGTILVLRAGEREFGLLVDGVLDSQEVVVKPLGRWLRGTAVFAGATILGDGRVTIILDVLALAQRAGVVIDDAEERFGGAEQEERGIVAVDQSMLLCASPDDGRLLMSLDDAVRIDWLDLGRVQHIGSLQVVQYRGDVLPLVDVSRVLPERRQRPRREGAAPRARNLVVYQKDGRAVGLVVDRVIDIVGEPETLHQPGTREHVLGTAIVDDRVAEVLDLGSLVRLGGSMMGEARGQETP